MQACPRHGGVTLSYRDSGPEQRELPGPADPLDLYRPIADLMQSTCTCPADLPDEVCGRCGGPLSECLPDERKRDGHWLGAWRDPRLRPLRPRRSADRVRVWPRRTAAGRVHVWGPAVTARACSARVRWRRARPLRRRPGARWWLSI